MQTINKGLTNVQREILKAFSFQLTDEDLKDFKHHLALYFAERATNMADKIWEEKGWTDEDVDRMLNTKMRAAKK